MSQNSKPPPEILKDEEARALHRIMMEKLLPAYHETVTWAIHALGRDYLRSTRAKVGTGVVGLFMDEIVREHAAALADPEDFEVAKQYFARLLIENLEINLGLQPNDKPIDPQASRDEAYAFVQSHVVGLMGRLDNSIALLTAPPDPPSRAGLLLITALISHLADRFDLARSRAVADEWVTGMVEAIGGSQVMVHVEMMQSPEKPNG